MAKVATRREKIDLRVSATAKKLLQDAAQTADKSLSEFVLESALARAEATLPDRRRFILSKEQWEAFQQALDAPTVPAPRLKRLLREPSVFEK